VLASLPHDLVPMNTRGCVVCRTAGVVNLMMCAYFFLSAAPGTPMPVTWSGVGTTCWPLATAFSTAVARLSSHSTLWTSNLAKGLYEMTYTRLYSCMILQDSSWVQEPHARKTRLRFQAGIRLKKSDRLRLFNTSLATSQYLWRASIGASCAAERRQARFNFTPWSLLPRLNTRSIPNRTIRIYHLFRETLTGIPLLLCPDAET